MELGEIFSDALVYPAHNIKALIIYIILGIIFGIASSGTVVAVLAGIAAEDIFAVFGFGVIGIIVALFIGFLISGYELDIIKYGINRDADSPGVDPIRQFINGVKLFVVNIVYYIIPIILGAILGLIFQDWLSGILTLIISIVFSLAAYMAQCRLAKTEDLGYALAFGDAIEDISRVGIVKLLLFIILVIIIGVIIGIILVLVITQVDATVGGILMGIIGVYFIFFSARATGLLYSDV